jgi:hypothetical protein
MRGDRRVWSRIPGTPRSPHPSGFGPMSRRQAPLSQAPGRGVGVRAGAPQSEWSGPAPDQRIGTTPGPPGVTATLWRAAPHPMGGRGRSAIHPRNEVTAGPPRRPGRVISRLCPVPAQRPTASLDTPPPFCHSAAARWPIQPPLPFLSLPPGYGGTASRALWRRWTAGVLGALSPPPAELACGKPGANPTTGSGVAGFLHVGLAALSGRLSHSERR